MNLMNLIGVKIEQNIKVIWAFAGYNVNQWMYLLAKKLVKQ